MTDLHRIPDATDRWRAMVEALEDIVLTGSGEREPVSQIDTAAAEEVRRVIMVRLAARRRDTLPAAWKRRPGIMMPGPVDPAPTPEIKEPPSDRCMRSWPVWRD